MDISYAIFITLAVKSEDEIKTSCCCFQRRSVGQHWPPPPLGLCTLLGQNLVNVDKRPFLSRP